MRQKIENGIYSDLNNDHYHNSDGISNSGISLILDCPRRYAHKYLSTIEHIRTKPMEIGSAFHTLCLEPKLFDEKYIVEPELLKPNFKKGLKKHIGVEAFAKQKQALAEIEQTNKALMDGFALQSLDKHVLSRKDFLMLEGMNESISRLPFMQAISKLENKIEHSLFWTDENYNVQIKTRPDLFNDQFILDLKTTDSAKEEDFKRSIFNYGYHRQAAIALDGVKAVTGQEITNFVIVAIEKEAPYLCAAYRLTNDAIERGREEYTKGLSIYAQCLENNKWPGYSEIITDIGLPEWAMKRII